MCQLMLISRSLTANLTACLAANFKTISCNQLRNVAAPCTRFGACKGGGCAERVEEHAGAARSDFLSTPF